MNCLAQPDIRMSVFVLKSVAIICARAVEGLILLSDNVSCFHKLIELLSDVVQILPDPWSLVGSFLTFLLSLFHSYNCQW